MRPSAGKLLTVALMVLMAAFIACGMAIADDADAANDSAQTAASITEPQSTLRPMTEREEALQSYLGDKVPSQEGWFIELTSQGKLVMLAMPDLLVWTVPEDGDLLELDWFIDLHTVLDDAEGNPSLETSPDGKHMLLCTSDGTAYLLNESGITKIRTLEDTPDDLIWSEDSRAYALLLAGKLYAYDLDGAQITVQCDAPIMPAADFYSWLGGNERPEALTALIADETKQYMGANHICAIFDSEVSWTTTAYMYADGKTVEYPGMLFSADEVSASGYAPLYDDEESLYRVYRPDGDWLDSPCMALLNGAEMANPSGWIGNSFCVLEQNSNRVADFALHMLNTLTSEERVLRPIWNAEDEE